MQTFCNIAYGKSGSFPRRCSQIILWNIQYDTVLNLKFTDHTRVVAFADDLILTIRADSISEAENIANIEMGKIAMWAKNNKTKFNEEIRK